LSLLTILIAVGVVAALAAPLAIVILLGGSTRARIRNGD
jgi:hypothetical protein